MNKVGFWFNNARPVALPQSMLPAFTAVAMAYASCSFSILMAALCIMGVVFAHLGMNLADDWFDYKLQVGMKRKQYKTGGMRARMIKYAYLEDGKATPGELIAVIAIFLGIAAACGSGVAFIRGWEMLYFVLAGFIIGISYSGGPLKLGFRGLGELVIFIMFGPLLMTGIYYACTGVLTSEIAVVSAAVGLLVTNIVYSHSVMDADYDIKVGKRTMAHLMGSRKWQIVLSGIFNIVPYILIVAGVAAGMLHWAYLFTLAVMPLSVWLVGSLADFAANRSAEIVVRPWMGPMGDFEGYKKNGMDWFMLRWLIARNIVSFFSFIIIVVNIVFAIVK